MNKIKSFLIGILLLIATFAMIVSVALLYRSASQLSVKTYIFQMDNYADNRVGALQKLEDMSAVELRNKLIRKYISEYFLVIPDEQNISGRIMLEKLSTPAAYAQWQSGEAKKIARMAKENMFRRVHVSDTDIIPLDMPDGYNYYNATPNDFILYSVRYKTETWTESNAMGIEPIYEKGNIYISIAFKPGIIKDVNVRDYLESGKNPIELFMFKVANVDNIGNE